MEKIYTPSGLVKDISLNLFTNVSPAAAVIYLDNQLSIKAVTPEDYNAIRGALMIRISNSDAMRKLIRDEWVIEGERRRPDLFLQMSIDNVKFDSLIYQRDDFNDYLDVDRKSRTRYIKLK